MRPIHPLKNNDDGRVNVCSVCIGFIGHSQTDTNVLIVARATEEMRSFMLGLNNERVILCFTLLLCFPKYSSRSCREFHCVCQVHDFTF